MILNITYLGVSKKWMIAVIVEKRGNEKNWKFPITIEEWNMKTGELKIYGQRQSSIVTVHFAENTDV